MSGRTQRLLNVNINVPSPGAVPDLRGGAGVRELRDVVGADADPGDADPQHALGGEPAPVLEAKVWVERMAFTSR